VTATEQLDYTIGARPQSAADAKRYFDKYWRAKLDCSKLIGQERRAYVLARRRYVRTCAALLASHEKQQELEWRATLALAWQPNPGESVWGVEVPDEVFDDHAPIVNVSTTRILPAARARESKPRRRGSATSRGGDSGDRSDEADPPGVARRERALRRGGVR
jgi:hypothetical protein